MYVADIRLCFIAIQSCRHIEREGTFFWAALIPCYSAILSFL
jgi:hypothetical protein